MSLTYEPSSEPLHIFVKQLKRFGVILDLSAGGISKLVPYSRGGASKTIAEREFFIDNLLVPIHFIIEMIWWTGLPPWKFVLPFPCSLTSNFLAPCPENINFNP